MKNVIILMIGLLLLSSCKQEKTNSKSEGSSNSSEQSVQNNNQNNNTGPTENTDPIDEDDLEDSGDDDISYYEDDDEDEETVQLPQVAVSLCGTVYREFNSSMTKFLYSGYGYTIEGFNYEAKNFLNTVSYPKDAYSVCFDGYVDDNNINKLLIDKITSQSETTNPDKPLKSYYTYELCGYVAYVQSYSGSTGLKIKVNGYTYQVKNVTGSSLPAGIPVVSGAIGADNSVIGCFYSDKASYKNYSVSFMPYFDAQNFDFGAL